MADGPSRETFPRPQRLRRRVDFLAVQERGRRFSSPHYLLLARWRLSGEAGDSDQQPQPARLGITVSRKVGGAVARNRVKRWVRESYRRMRSLAPPGMDLVVIARPGAPQSGLQTTESELRSLLARLCRS